MKLQQYKEIIVLIHDGHTQKETAEKLKLHPNTVQKAVMEIKEVFPMLFPTSVPKGRVLQYAPHMDNSVREQF